jgi:hypothetical protein
MHAEHSFGAVLGGQRRTPPPHSARRACAQVKEALMTSALLKLPQSTPYPRKEERVEQILSELVRGPAPCSPWLGPSGAVQRPAGARALSALAEVVVALHDQGLVRGSALAGS